MYITLASERETFPLSTVCASCHTAKVPTKAACLKTLFFSVLSNIAGAEVTAGYTVVSLFPDARALSSPNFDDFSTQIDLFKSFHIFHISVPNISFHIHNFISSYSGSSIGCVWPLTFSSNSHTRNHTQGKKLSEGGKIEIF